MREVPFTVTVEKNEHPLKTSSYLFSIPLFESQVANSSKSFSESVWLLVT